VFFLLEERELLRAKRKGKEEEKLLVSPLYYTPSRR